MVCVSFADIDECTRGDGAGDVAQAVLGQSIRVFDRSIDCFASIRSAGLRVVFAERVERLSVSRNARASLMWSDECCDASLGKYWRMCNVGRFRRRSMMMRMRCVCKKLSLA